MVGQGKEILLICLYVFLGVLTIALISFFVVFLLQRIAIKKQYKLMKRFNYFNDNPIASNLKPISYLVEKNDELKPLYDYFLKLNESYKSQMEVIKKQIFDLSKYIKNFHIFRIWKYLNIISNNLDVIQNEEDSFRLLNIDTYSYTNNTSDISVRLSEIMNKLNSFMINNNIKKEFYQSNDSLKNYLEKIEIKTKEINENLMSTNITVAHRSFVNAIIPIQELFELVNDYYQIYRYQMFVKSLTSNLKKTIEENKDDIKSKNIIQEIKLLMDNSNKKFLSSNKALWSKDLDAVKKILSSQIVSMDKCIIDIITEVKFKKLLDKSFNEFKTMIKEFVNKYNSNELIKTYEKIGEDFIDDVKISDLLILCTNTINEIFKDIEDFKKVLSSKKINSKQTIETIGQIYKKIDDFFEKNKELKGLLTNKIELYYSTVYTINNCITTLNFLLYIMDENGIKSNEIKYDINNILLTLKNYQDKVSKTKNIDTKWINELNNIENSIEKITDEISDFLTLKKISKKLMMHFNRNIKEEPSVIAKCSQLINNGQYKEAIDEFIDFSYKLKKNKKGGKNAYN